MSIATEADLSAEIDRRIRLQYRVEQFYYNEAELLDEHRYNDWVALFTDDTHYFMPLRRTVLRRDRASEFTKPGESAFFDDDKKTLLARVAKLNSGTAWAEDPPSRTRHFVTNVRVVDESTPGELVVKTNFILFRSRLKSEEDKWVGHRQDTLRMVDGGFRIASRTIRLEETILLSRNISNFM